MIGRNSAFTYEGKSADLEADRTRAEREVCIEEAFSGVANGCASTFSSPMRKLAPISGRNASISPWPAVQAAAEANLVKALSLAPDHAVAHLGLGGVQIMTNRPTQGIAECERALALNKNQADAHATIAVVKYFTGHALEMEGHIQEAFRIRPCDKWAHVWMALIGTANLAPCRDEEAVAWLRRAIENNRNSPTSHLQLAAAICPFGSTE